MSKARDLAGIFNLGPRSGTTAQRPSTAEVGDIFYNGTTGKTEIYTITGWKEMASGIPFGNTAARPAAVQGQPYFNGETQRLELFTGTSWENIVQEVPGVASISGNYSEATDSGVITIYGTNFVNGAYATAIGANGVQINATSTVYNSLVQLTATFSGLSNAQEPYDIKVTNPSNLFGIIPDALYINASPVWVTNAGSLGTFDELVSINLSALSATDSDSTITYALASGSSLPSGVTLNGTTGVISGMLPNVTSDTTYNFTINATDGINTIPRSFSITSIAFISSEVLVVGGGGGSGGTPNDAWYPGAGGAGGYRTSTSLQFLPNSTYNVVVGQGGAAGTGGTTTNSTRGSSGQASSLTYRLGTFSASGGGGGGAGHAMTAGQAALSGGSGGGGASNQANIGAGGAGNAGSYSPSEGNSGGAGLSGGSGYSGSGGGAAGPGSTMASAGGPTIPGGSGVTNSITGSAVTYATGGSLLMNTVSLGTPTPNSGNGSNAGALNPSGSPANGGAGAAGVVVIKVPVQASSTTGSPTYTPSGGFHIYRFTNNGTITF
jgi:hypothetical protein